MAESADSSFEACSATRKREHSAARPPIFRDDGVASPGTVQVTDVVPSGPGGPRPSPSELDRFFNASLDLLCIVDADGRLRRVNPAFAEVLGYPLDELVGKIVWDFVHPDDMAATRSYLTGLLPGGERVDHQTRWVCPDGSYRTLVWSAARSEEGDEVFAIARDVTTEKETEADLRRAVALSDEANTAKSEFLANMSHEIRTPMNGIIGLTDLTLDTLLTDQQREYLQMVQTSAAALLDIINSILDFSKIEAGRMELDEVDFTLWETVTGALKPLALTGRNKGVELLYDEGSDVPERLRGDPGRLRQALTNLVGNAVKFTESGSVRLTVSRVTSHDTPIRLSFEVADTGIGIPEGKLRHIFGSFNQVDGSMTRRFGGTGLGLPITSGIVRMMGGTIDVTSSVGEGSTFSFEADFTPASTPFDATRPRGRLSGIRVIAVDDHEANRRILVDFARRLDMIVESAASGPEALEILGAAHDAGSPIDLALLDCHMPGMGGFELAERIREDPRLADVLMVAFTAAGRPGDGARCEELGISSYLLKPLAPAELREALLLTLEQGREAQNGGELVTRHSLREARLSLRVLLAEDNRVNQRLATHILERFGHRVELARTGKEAVEAVLRDRFDVILMDIQMPEMDGLEATRRIREFENGKGRRTPIVAMTAHAMVGDRDRFIEAGMDDYVSKPISRDRLREVLRGVQGMGTPPQNEATSAVTSVEPSTASAPFERAAFMAQADHDVDLVCTLVKVFTEDRPMLTTRIEEALGSRDAEAIERSAHAIKGALGVFVAEPAYECALHLESLARDGDVESAQDWYPELLRTVLFLEDALRELVAELTP